MLNEVTQVLGSPHSDRALFERLATGGPLAEMLAQVVVTFEAGFPEMLGSILLLDDAGRKLRTGAAPHLPPAFCAAIDGVEIGPVVGSCGTAAFTGTIVVVTDIESDPLWADFKDLALAHGLRACWSVPIRGTSGRILGTFAFYFTTPRAPEPGDVVALERGAQLVAMVIERHLSDRALQQSEARFRAMFEQAGVGVAQKAAATGRFVRVNQKYADIVGYPREQLKGLCFQDITHPDDLGAELAHMDRLRAGDIPSFTLEKRCLTKIGEVRWVRLTVSPMWAPGAEPDFHVAIVEDITDRKRIEADNAALDHQLQHALKLESVGRLAGGVAHDFNNMLGVILGYTIMAMDQVGSDHPIHPDLTEIRKAAERSASLTRQLLAFARKQTVTPKLVNINEPIGELLKMLPRILGEDIRVVWEPDTHLWPVMIDPSQIDQIVTNLAVNARDAMAGGGRLVLKTTNQVIAATDDAVGPLPPGRYVRLTVSDDGCGMGPDVLGHIFEPFFTTKDVGVGTGLGLATVYGVVTQNHGFIDVDSTPGEGTTFEIFLPRHDGVAEHAEGDVGSSPQKRAGTILLVEDEPSLLRITTRLLQREGFSVVAADGPDEALRLAALHGDHIHLLLTDVIMPGMHGRDLASAIRGQHPTIKCLFMSGYTADVIAHHGVLQDDVQFIQKPFSSVGLLNKVRAALDAPG